MVEEVREFYFNEWEWQFTFTYLDLQSCLNCLVFKSNPILQ